MAGRGPPGRSIPARRRVRSPRRCSMAAMHVVGALGSRPRLPKGEVRCGNLGILHVLPEAELDARGPGERQRRRSLRRDHGDVP